NITNSETRSPQPYNTSRIALFRIPSIVDESIAAISASISSIFSTLGILRFSRGVSSNSVGLSFRSYSICRKTKNRSEERRVGKECRTQRTPNQQKKTEKQMKTQRTNV